MSGGLLVCVAFGYERENCALALGRVARLLIDEERGWLDGFGIYSELWWVRCGTPRCRPPNARFARGTDEGVRPTNPARSKARDRPALCIGMNGTRALPDLCRENSNAGAEAPSNFIRSTRPLKGRSSAMAAHSRKVRIPTLIVAKGATFRMGHPRYLIG